MTLDRLETAISRHGADLGRWPAAERAAAAALAAADPAARRALDDAAALEAAFAAARARPEPAPAALLERVMADAATVAAGREATRRPVAARRFGLRLGGMARPALACAASALLGLWLGQSAMVAQAATGFMAETPTTFEETLDGPEIAVVLDELPEAWE